MNTKRLWIGFIAVMVVSFAILGYYGFEVYFQKPPIPDRVVSDSGEQLFTGNEIVAGQNVWQSIGGQEVGSIWGHGAYVAPDWSADWLHREAVYMLNRLAFMHDSCSYDELDSERQAYLQLLLQKDLRKNRYDATTKTLVVSDLRAEAIKDNAQYYHNLFTDGKDQERERIAYAIPVNSIKNVENMQRMNAFFFWTAWACVTERPGKDITYTSNWPGDDLVGNHPTSQHLFWSMFSIILLLLGIGLLGFYYAKNQDKEISEVYPEKDPLINLQATPSMKATLKYFWVVTGLILLQILMGAVTAHYGVEGQGFYGLNLDAILPYSISRTWHVQLAIFWIATAWLAAGLFIAPAVSGVEPKYQRLGVNVLFGALLVVVLGSFAGEWMGVMQKMGIVQNFYFGHQGYEYIDLGRFWQILLFGGLVIWLFLMIRALLPALKQKTDNKQLLILFVVASIAIAAFYGAGLMYGRESHLSVVEYWRWWVVHLWVEGFFEVFATAIIAFIFVKLGLLNVKRATAAALFTAIIYLFGGIVGTFHHTYFAGTPMSIIALGASFSALEVVPLVMIGAEAWGNYKLTYSTDWIRKYRWAIYSFIAVAFWNLVGAGIFGFLINPPIALYYMQGLNTTPVHGHTALFGVYGMLGIALMIFSLRGMTIKQEWNEKVLSFSFWCFQIGLILMVLISILPVGVKQTIASVDHGLWYARSMEFMQAPAMQTLRWLRIVGDTIFAFGGLGLAYFVIGLKTGWSLKK
ncbi:MAG: nitric-oxide reductase large subunit [Tenuifilaceae bacterium]|jgi:nitric oxide reductase subunit B|nr:nitric-oxide reductase large subunit [Bacteroidales bacterium]MDI9515552.1 nitric-oxide reductase large subunit [Bacteroidota bacterium]OQC64571.1 MAG: Nitric oxide reductase subunit B [Bacteroidetes bacterium ADurb.Bin008]HNV81358.1 nitric-oxide reductase large subunit [Tenuifilaceae bacterium]MZP81791.1 nitric-oxide reductase large subunit [Bacteroidales bacterium]